MDAAPRIRHWVYPRVYRVRDVSVSKGIGTLYTTQVDVRARVRW